MKGIGGRLIGEAEKFSFEERIFNFVMLLAIFMTIFGTVMDVYYGVDILVDLFFVGCWILTYYLSRFKGHFNTVSAVSTGVFVFAFIPYTWITSGGSSGVIPYYTVVFIAVISIVLKGSFRTVLILSILAVELLLIFRDAYLTGSIHTAFPRNIQFFDFSIHIFVIMAAVAVLIVIYSNTYMREKERSEKYSRTIEENYHQQIYYMENLEQLIYRLKSERHDFNNHLGVIYGLLESSEADKAGLYVRQLVKTAEEYQNIVNIPYPMIRAILNYKLSVARGNEIELRLDVSLPERLPLSEFDLAVILGNLLDNAAEACAAVEEGSRYIGLKLQYKPDYLILQVENPVRGKKAFGGSGKYTTKPDAENHGFGLGNIEYLVSKHNGLMRVEAENGVFTVDIALLVD